MFRFAVKELGRFERPAYVRPMPRRLAPAPSDSPPPPGGPAEPTLTSPFLCWRGFHLAWRYNHRLNRGGSYVARDDDGRSWLVASAAAGTGKDTATLDVAASWILGERVQAITGGARFTLLGKEGEVLHGERRVLIALPADERAHWADAAAVLSGFDLCCAPPEDGSRDDRPRPDAQKLERLVLELTRVERTPEGLALDLHVEFVGSCRSPECRWFSKALSYRLDVRYAIIGGAALVAHKGMEVRRDIAWDKASAVTPEVDTLRATLTDRVSVAAAGFSRLEWSLDQEHHIVDLGAIVGAPTRTDGEWLVPWQLAFANWRPGMMQYNLLSFPTAGSALLRGRVELLGFEDAAVLPLHVQGAIAWPGQAAFGPRGLPPTDASATWSTVAEVPESGTGSDIL